jgi:Outer membrane receptor proteins, mostly Fe transport
VTDAKGNWHLNTKHRISALTVSYVGYKTKTMQSLRYDGKPISVRLQIDETNLEGVVVVAKREERALRESAMPISVISMRQLQGTASSIDEVLSRTTGVTLRNMGGLGSASRISLRGLEGKRMGVYIDEIPFGEMSDFISINDIPTDMIERVEVYKGIVPYKFGGSAMGGAVNVVLKEYPPKYFDASYEVGSYNSHMLSTVFKRTLSDLGLQFGLGGTFAYSDNNYKMELPHYKERTVRRDHDQFKKAILGGSLKATKWWFDEVKLELAGTYIRREIQGFEWNVREAFTLSKGLALASTFKRADFFIPGLDLDASMGVVFGQNGLTDKARHRYDWDGKEYPSGSSYGGELSNIPSDGTNRTVNIVDKLNLNYTVDRHQAINLNLFHSYAYRNPTDTLMDRALGYKANFKSHMNSLTAGASYDVTLLDDRLQNALTAKYYNYRSHSKVIGTISQNDLKDVQTNRHFLGWSEAIRYRFTPDFLIKASYADEVRIPTSEELLGNGYSISASTDLRPEHSRGGNIGLVYRKVSPSSGRLIEAEVNAFSSYLTDMIRFMPGLIPSMSCYRNFGSVRTWGIEGEVKWDALPWLYLYGNATYQDLRDTRRTIPSTNVANPTYLKRMPNIPYLLANTGLELHKENLFGGQGYNSRLMLDASYVHQYFYDFEVSQYQERKIPTALRLDLGLEQSLRNNQWTITFKVKNLTNQRQMSEFNHPLPGINFSVKLRYLFR